MRGGAWEIPCSNRSLTAALSCSEKGLGSLEEEDAQYLLTMFLNEMAAAWHAAGSMPCSTEALKRLIM